MGYLWVLKALIRMANILKDFPPEVKKAILIKQAEMKVIKNQGKYSQKHALIQIVKEWMGIISTLDQAKRPS